MLFYKNLDANRFLFISEGLWVNKKPLKKLAYNHLGQDSGGAIRKGCQTT